MENTENKEVNNIRQKFLSRLENIASLEYDWDGNGAVPVSPIVLETVKDVLLKVPEYILNEWRLFPELNGTLLISAKDKAIMGLSIGDKGFSYVGRKGDKRIAGKLPTNAEEIINVLTELTQLKLKES